MDFDTLTDADLKTLRDMPKRAEDPKDGRCATQRGSEQVTYSVVAVDGDLRFSVYTRQSKKDPRSYSAGILAVNLSGSKKTLMLSRYNGSDHIHGEYAYKCHIHRTIAASRRDKEPEGRHADPANYTDIKGALRTLIKEYNVQGIKEVLL